MTPLQAASIALCAAAGISLMCGAIFRLRGRRSIERRIQSLGADWPRSSAAAPPPRRFSARQLAGRLGTSVAQRLPTQVDSLAARVDRAGLTGGISSVELLGWKVVCAAFGGAVGIWGTLHYGAGGLAMLVAGLLIGWFGTDVMLMRYHEQRRRSILRDLPTMMDLLVLSLEAGMGLDRALRTVIAEYHTALADEIRRVLRDVQLGLGRGEAFERMALRVGLEDLGVSAAPLSRAKSLASASSV